MSEFHIRPATSDDLGMIYSSWSAGQHSCPPWCLEPDELFRPRHRAFMDRCMERGATLVATPPDDDPTGDEILGWLCYEMAGDTLVVHWLYVKNAYREMGVASELLETAAPAYDGPVVATGCSKMMLKWIQKRVEVIFDPGLVGRA